MNLSRNPVTWAAGIAGVLVALVQVGVLTQLDADRVNGWLQAALPVLAFLVPLAAGFLAKRRTAPLKAGVGAEPAQLLRGIDGVYREPTVQGAPKTWLPPAPPAD